MNSWINKDKQPEWVKRDDKDPKLLQDYINLFPGKIQSSAYLNQNALASNGQKVKLEKGSRQSN